MTAGDWLATAAGAVLVGVTLREVFKTLLHPGGRALLAPALFRASWEAGRRLGPRAAHVAAPLAIVATLVFWSGGMLLGFALMYWPHMPSGFQLASGLDPADNGGLLDAMWVSGVTLTTLGLGDMAAEARGLRLLQVTEAMLGFALLSAGISWVLSLYPALHRSRVLGLRAGALVDADGRLVTGDPPATLALVLHQVADAVADVRVDLIHFPSVYFFREPAEDLLLATPLHRLLEALQRDDVPPEARTAADMVLRAIESLADTLASGPFGIKADDESAALLAFAERRR